MKTITKLLYYKQYKAPIAYGYKENHFIESYIKIKLVFDFRDFLRFVVTVPNASYCYKNPIKALLRALEHESIGMSKYSQLKQDVRNCGMWKKLDVFK